MSQINLALLILAAAAAGGLFMALRVFGGKAPPKLLPIGHGLAGLAGLVALFLAVNAGAGGKAPLAMWIIGGAALGGLYLASFHFRKAAPPKLVVAIHAIVAATGVALLAMVAAGMI